MLEEDRYFTIAGPAEATFRERGSRFLAYAWPVRSEEEVKPLLDALRKRYHDATHHCYAWRLGAGSDEQSRMNDDGEPAGTAGRPILGQMMSRGVTNLLVVVVRYFGGTKLGVPGLIAAYKESAAAALERAQVVERTVDVQISVTFPYLAMNEVMRAVKESKPEIAAQHFDNICRMELTIRRSREAELTARLKKIEGVQTATRNS